MFAVLQIRNCYFHYNIDLIQIFFWLCKINKLIGYLAFVVYVSSNPCAGPSPISICTDELISAPKLMKFLPKFSSATENFEQALNPIP